VNIIKARVNIKKSVTVSLMLALSLCCVASFSAPFGVASTSASSTATPAASSAPTSTYSVPSSDQGSNQAAANTSTTSSDSKTDDSSLGDTKLSEEAFAKTMQNSMPMTPSQIKTMRKMYDSSQKAAASYPGTSPKPTSSSIIVSLAPGATPPLVRLRAGYVSSLVFVDSTGQPWPITAYDIGNPSTYNLQPTTPDGKTNTLMIQSKSSYEPGNLAVMLSGLNTPVMLTLMPGQQAVDYRVDFRVPGLGPNAQVVDNGMPQSADPMLLSFLDGVAPTGSKLLKLKGGGDSQIWLYAQHLYLRTRLTLMSPSWRSKMSSPDGTHAYELEKTPIVLVSDHGKMMQLNVEGL